MVRLTVILFVFAVLACGGSDTGNTEEAGGAAPAAKSAAAPEKPAPSTMPAASAETDPKVEGCLDLVRRGKYEPAVPLCLAALKIDPNNQQVRDAVDKARAETAKMAASKAATGAASGAAAEAAGGAAAEQGAAKLGEATGGMTDKLGQ